MQKKYAISLGILIVLAVGFGYLASWNLSKKAKVPDALVVEPVSTAETRTLCFYDSVPQPDGVKDTYSMVLGITGNQVDGTLYISPGHADDYEKNARFGRVVGTVGPLDPMTMSRTVEALWTAEVDLRNVSTDIKIQFGDGSAAVAFGHKPVGQGFSFGEDEKPDYSLQLLQMACPE